jgi:serine/threonine-protein kinase
MPHDLDPKTAAGSGAKAGEPGAPSAPSSIIESPRAARESAEGDAASAASEWALGLDGSFGQTGSMTGELRRARLSAAAAFFVVVFGASLLLRPVIGGGVPIALHAAIVCGSIVMLALLTSPVSLDAWNLHLAELAVFGLVLLFLAVRQYRAMVYWAALNDEATLLWTVKTTIIGTMLLMFAYCMLIPNTWQASARVVGAIVAVSVATELGFYLANPTAFRNAWPFISVERVSQDVLLVAIAACLSVYGTHVINSLRVEAFEAHQLNQYRLGKKLGTGGMGEVYLAEHRLLKRPCALKLIRPDTAADPVLLGRFEREVRATALLSHPNTVEIYDYGRTEGGTFYYVMEYLRGMSLDEIVKRFGPMRPARVIHLLRQVCGALAEAHAAGLIHRDVKPANIFACVRAGHYDVAKLLDFGLVKTDDPGDGELVEEAGRAGMVQGTPLYMAPEQVAAQPALDYRCDLYALGGVAYMLLTGRPPFQGETRLSVMMAHAREPVEPLRQSNPEIPEDLEAVVLRCLAKQPSERFQDASSIDDALAVCQSAGEWDDEKAARWWHEFAPEASAPVHS